jgi:ABC-type bacteriocin/lantibiotic exporter with double-glycine peptidase domain
MMIPKFRIGLIISLLIFIAGAIIFNKSKNTLIVLSAENIIFQKNQNDCGIAAAKNVLVAFHKNPNVMDTLLKVGEYGVTLLDIKTALTKQGLNCTGYKTTLRDLAELPLPAIAHVSDNHFVVVESVEAESVVLIDPGVGRLKYRASAFEEKWDGVVLCVSEKL